MADCFSLAQSFSYKAFRCLLSCYKCQDVEERLSSPVRSILAIACPPSHPSTSFVRRRGSSETISTHQKLGHRRSTNNRPPNRLTHEAAARLCFLHLFLLFLFLFPSARPATRPAVAILLIPSHIQTYNPCD